MAAPSFQPQRNLWNFSVMVLAVLALPGLLPAEIELSPLYSDNMVLQQKMINWISGKATPNAQITITYKQVSKSATVTKTGDWKVPLNLKALTDTSASDLEIVETTAAHRSSVTLSNVVVGNVWLLGVLSNNGIPANSTHISRLSPQDRIRIRFLNAPDLESQRPRPVRSASPAWHTFSERSLDKLSLMAFTPGMALELGSGHVGIIQTSPDAIARLGRVKSSSAPPGSRRAEIQTLLEGVRSSANQEVRDVRNTNQLQRIAAKHEGIVRDIPMPIEYKLSRAHLRGDFNFSSESFSQLNFEGAIW